jgi:hypothetical protein
MTLLADVNRDLFRDTAALIDGRARVAPNRHDVPSLEGIELITFAFQAPNARAPRRDRTSSRGPAPSVP